MAFIKAASVDVGLAMLYSDENATVMDWRLVYAALQMIRFDWRY